MKLTANDLLRFLPGAVFGLYMAHLLFFLNPQLEVSPARLALFGATYAILCSAIFGSILWTLRRLTLHWRQSTDPHGFGFTVAAVFIATLVYWGHLAMFRIYLPRGAVRILSKATSILAATAFVLFILWILERTAPRRVRRTIGVLGLAAVVASSFFLYQRREGYRTDPRVPVVANVGTIANERRIVFVAVRNLPYDWIVRMKGEGALPNLARLTEGSFFTRLEPFRTTSPKALWASLATGKLPHRHGVTGRFSYETALNREGERLLIVPSWVGFRAWGLIPPVRRISAQLPSGDALPFWRMVHRLGVGAAVVNWPSAAAEPLASIIVSDRFFGEESDPRAVFPPEFAPTAEGLRVQAAAVDAQTLRRFTDTGDRRHEILRNLISDLSAASLAKSLAAQKVNMLTVVALNGLERAQQIVETGNELPAPERVAGEVIRAYLGEIDRALGEIANAAPDATLVIVSPSGALPPPLPASSVAVLRSLLLLDDPGSDDGFLLVRGPGVIPRDNPAPAQVVDVVPTLLFSAGLPVSRDMDGRLLTEAFEERFLRTNPLSIIQTYETERLIIHRGDVVEDHRVSHRASERL